MDYQGLYNRYIQGESIRELANEHELHFTTLYNNLKHFQPFPVPSGRYKKIGDEDRAWIADLYQQGATIQMLADEWHVAKRTITQILDKAGIKRRKAGRSKK